MTVVIRQSSCRSCKQVPHNVESALGSVTTAEARSFSQRAVCLLFTRKGSHGRLSNSPAGGLAQQRWVAPWRALGTPSTSGNPHSAMITYPINGAEVHSLRKVKALVKAAVVGSWKGDHELPSTLVSSVNLERRDWTFLRLLDVASH